MGCHRHNLRVLALAAVAMASIGLQGCFGNASDLPPAPSLSIKPVDLKPICGQVKIYSPAESAALAAALEHLDPHNPLVAAIGDYRRMREEARACQASAGSK